MRGGVYQSFWAEKAKFRRGRERKGSVKELGEKQRSLLVWMKGGVPARSEYAEWERWGNKKRLKSRGDRKLWRKRGNGGPKSRKDRERELRKVFAFNYWAENEEALSAGGMTTTKVTKSHLNQIC